MLKKHKRLGVFDNIWENIPPYPGYQPPGKRYQQITMWGIAEMRGINRVILACFTAALRRTTASPKLSPAAQGDSKVAIQCMHTITDFCLMAQYRRHTSQNIGYMNKYLRQFHQHMHIFSEFWASEADHQEATKVSQGLVEGKTPWATIHQYFPLIPTQLAKRSAKDREVRHQAAYSILQ